MSKKTIAKGYYAVFKYSSEAVEVEFPDLNGCYTSGSNMEEAYEFATDALSGWLEHAEDKYIPENRLTFDEIKRRFSNDEIMFVTVDTSIMKKYEEKQRFNASFPKSILQKVDEFASAKGWNRSQFLIKASEKAMEENSIC